MLKRAFDFIAALFGLIVLVPVFLLIGIALRLESPGPVFYKSPRVGRGGRPFGMYKFRTMRYGPNGNGNGPRVTARDDPRVTRLGRVLRQTKLNELPQLLNVLRGEMSLVGPRPEDPGFVAHYSAEEREVLSVRPGITCPAAIMYFDEEALLRYETAAQAYLKDILPPKLRIELLYVRNRNFLLDLDVLFRTFVALVPLIRRAAPEVEELLLGPVQRLFRRHIPWFVVDWLTAFTAVAAAGLVWRMGAPLDLGWPLGLLAAFLLALVFSLANSVAGLQRVAWRYASASEILGVTLTAMFATIILLGLNRIPSPFGLFPPAMLLLAGLLALAGFVVVRYRRRLLTGLAWRWGRFAGALHAVQEKVLVIGGGEAGQMLVWLLRSSPRSSPFQVVGIVDDDLWMRGARIHGVPVLGTRRQIPQLVREHGVELLVFAIHQIDPAESEAILQICYNTPARVVILPDIVSVLGHLADGREKRPAPSIDVTPNAPWRPAVVPPVKIGVNGGTYVEAATVSVWLSDLARLAAEGRLEDVEQCLGEIQASLGLGPLPPDRRSLPVAPPSPVSRRPMTIPRA